MRSAMESISASAARRAGRRDEPVGVVRDRHPRPTSILASYDFLTAA
ncbi:hypothetical protein Voc01_077530 [Virgisporangium ochraceum]|uniref:Uncharacterized protein n=1 Tax=Virgisporangium ochraceum TaxID=65505 RepID=A0A8J4EFL2_9ACTN|nr:hypothetical protein Voc01_077530 [Virgisporangium ochraceum]